MMERLNRFSEAYLAMAEEARYRPEAPGDGFGAIYLSKAEMADPARLRQEAARYAIAFNKEDDALTFRVGCSNFDTNRALVYTIEAARLLCGGDNGNAIATRLLKMAIKEIAKVPDRKRQQRRKVA